MTEEAFKILLQGAEEHGLLEKRDEQDRRERAKKMLMRGYPVEDIAEIMELPVETVINLQQEL